jgi:SAM-dependent methyltransferase
VDVTNEEPWEPAVRARRAASFGGQAAAYAEHRPDYPVAAVRWALEPVAGRRPLRVLDLAAGTGKLTGVLISDGHEVLAVEPDAAMLAELHRRLPHVPAFTGTAEDIPLPDAAVDAVLVGQAFHWFDPARALPEIGRVLAPGGVLAALWYFEDDRVAWVAGLAAVTYSSATYTRWRNQHGLPPSDLFDRSESAHFDHAQRRTAASLLATIGTHSHVLVLDEEERATLMARVRAYLRARPETASGEFDLRMVTKATRAVRRP